MSLQFNPAILANHFDPFDPFNQFNRVLFLDQSNQLELQN